MNPLAHVLIAYIMISFLIPDVHVFIIPIMVFSMLVDMDHLPGYIRLLTYSKKRRKSMSIEDHIRNVRTVVQEPVGIIILELLLLSLYLLGVRSPLLMMAALCFPIHWLVDFLTVHTRPLYPADKRIVSLFFHTKKQRVVSEVIITILSIILFLLVYF